MYLLNSKMPVVNFWSASTLDWNESLHAHVDCWCTTLSMPPDPGVAEFLERALAANIPHESLVRVLTERGWPEKEVYAALADQYQRLTGIEVPRRTTAASASAKEAFFYLLIFTTLATWTIGFGSLAFDLIDRWIFDPLFRGYQLSYDSYSMAWSLAALLVAFPLYLVISWVAAGEAARQPEKLDSPVRKWLTYLALVIAACVFMGDLITALNHLLRGELTARFVLKACVVLALSGGVFFYYFSGGGGPIPWKPGRAATASWPYSVPPALR